MKSLKGFLYGILSSASFGLIPLFSLPVLQSGLGFMSVLFYRFIFATCFLAITLLMKKQSLRIEKSDLLPLFILAVFYLISSVFLLWGYNYMASGIATTIHFMYPVITTLIMMFFFHEKKSLWRIGAVVMAIVGVYFLSNTGGDQKLSGVGILIVLISAVGYASYLVALGQMKRIKVRGLKLTFYVFFMGSIMLSLGMGVTQSIEPISGGKVIGNLLLLALIPTVISNLALVEAIKHIGSTLASVLGAMEPVTAVLVGILVFNEPFTTSIAVGILLIITAVSVIILKR